MENNLAYIDADLCTLCRKWVEVCPTHSIIETNFPEKKPKKVVVKKIIEKAVEKVEAEKTEVEKAAVIKQTVAANVKQENPKTDA